jgi:hypothetical protein
MVAWHCSGTHTTFPHASSSGERQMLMLDGNTLFPQCAAVGTEVVKSRRRGGMNETLTTHNKHLREHSWCRCMCVCLSIHVCMCLLATNCSRVCVLRRCAFNHSVLIALVKLAVTLATSSYSLTEARDISEENTRCSQSSLPLLLFLLS